MAQTHAQQEVIKDGSQSQRTYDAGITQDQGFSQRSAKHDGDDGSETGSEGPRGLPEMERQPDQDGDDEMMEEVDGCLTDSQLAEEEYGPKDGEDWEAEGFSAIKQRKDQAQISNLNAPQPENGNGKGQVAERPTAKEASVNYDHSNEASKSVESRAMALNGGHDHRQPETPKQPTKAASAHRAPQPPGETSTNVATDDQPQPDLSKLSWHELYQAFGDRMSAKTSEEEELKARFQKLTAMYLEWASVPLLQEEERAAKRLRTRIAFVQHQQDDLQQRQAHRDQVTEAFKKAFDMLST